MIVAYRLGQELPGHKKYHVAHVVAEVLAPLLLSRTRRIILMMLMLNQLAYLSSISSWIRISARRGTGSFGVCALLVL
jgi:hypothetical protein